MDLTRMQDIAGCRIFFPSIKDLMAFRSTFLHLKLRNVARISKDDQYNYIKKPKRNMTRKSLTLKRIVIRIEMN